METLLSTSLARHRRFMLDNLKESGLWSFSWSLYVTSHRSVVEKFFYLSQLVSSSFSDRFSFFVFPAFVDFLKSDAENGRICIVD